MTDEPLGPVDATVVPRFAGPPTFARLPRLDEVERADVAVIGVPFDSGVSYRPGARFGPAHIRQSSRLLRPYNPAQDISPFAVQQVADAGDIAANPFDIQAAIAEIEAAARSTLETATRLLTLGGDHTIALPLLRATASRHGPVAVLHFDAHLDTWDTYFGEPYTHGTPFRRASEEGLIDRARSAARRHPRTAVCRHRPDRLDASRVRHSRLHRLRPAWPRRGGRCRCESGWTTVRSTSRSTST